MATARITTIGLFNHDSTIFQSLNLPEGIDKPTAVNHFLLKYGECPVMYPDPDFYRFAVKIWSDTHFDALTRIYAAMTAEYNPIHNFDRNEEWVNTPDLAESHSGADTTKTDSTRTDDLTHTDTRRTDTNNTQTDTRRTDTSSTQTDERTVENKVSADNESVYQPNAKTENGGDVDTVGYSVNSGTLADSGSAVNSGALKDTGTVVDDGTQTLTHGHVVKRTGIETHRGHLYGNIGVTKTQEMIIDEEELRLDHNIYDIVSDLLRADLCLYVY